MTNETAAPGCIEINTPKTSVARSIILIVHANIKYYVAEVYIVQKDQNSVCLATPARVSVYLHKVVVEICCLIPGGGISQHSLTIIC